MASVKTSGIVVRKLNLGEADRLLTILTPDRGKIRVLAKGVRRPKAKLSGWLDMFAYNDLMLAEGRNFYIVTSAVTTERLINSNTNLEKIGTMYYVCELTDRLIEESISDVEYQLKGAFDLLRDTLRYIKTNTALKTAKSYFEMRLLKLLGVEPELNKSVISGQPLDGAHELSFSPRLGGVLQGNDKNQDELARSIDINAVKFLRLLQNYPLAEAAKVKVPDEVLDQASAVMADFVEYVTEVRTKSAAIIGELA